MAAPLPPSLFQTAAWGAVRDYLERDLQRLRTENDRPQNDAVATASLRGKISYIKHLLALEIAPAQEADPE